MAEKISDGAKFQDRSVLSVPGNYIPTLDGLRPVAILLVRD
jgi:hypothetical protein